MLLMHKDTPAAKIHYNGSVITNVTILDEKHYPVGASQRPRLAASDLQRWFAKRTIPAERQGLAAIESAIGCNYRKPLFFVTKGGFLLYTKDIL